MDAFVPWDEGISSSMMPVIMPPGIAVPEWNPHRRPPRSKQDLLDMLPAKYIADRLVMRYFTSGSASLRMLFSLVHLTHGMLHPAPGTLSPALLSVSSECSYVVVTNGGALMLIIGHNPLRRVTDVVHKPSFVRKVSTQRISTIFMIGGDGRIPCSSLNEHKVCADLMGLEAH